MTPRLTFVRTAIDRRWNNYNNYVDNAKSLGKLLLLARRLCERGCGFVTVTTNFVWDMHADVNNAPCDEGMRYMGRPLDHALSAFIEDMEERGLSDEILLVVCGEMGRTPRVNNARRPRSLGQPARSCWPAAACGWARSSAAATASPANPPRIPFAFKT